METKYKYGFLYPLYKSVIEFIKEWNAVEKFKDLAVWFGKRKGFTSESEKKACKRIGTDSFIVFKWLVVCLLWMLNWNGIAAFVIISYLIFTNVFTYYYYHVWDEDALKSKGDFDSIKRRFFNLLLAIAYSEFCFAYLYTHQFLLDFKFNDSTSYILQSFWFSISNSLAANYDNVKIESQVGYSITMIQLIVTFAFITIILSNSIPETEENE